MYIKTVQNHCGLKKLRKNKGLSEREVAEKAGLSRLTLRAVEQHSASAALQSYAQVSGALDQTLLIMCFENDDFFSEYSTIAVCLKTQMSGFESWQQNFFELIDEFRRTSDPRLIMLPPPRNFDMKLSALLAAIVCELCLESLMDVPHWARRVIFLETPWFPAESENLKAMALLESPLSFRRSNIFVLDNFLRRA